MARMRTRNSPGQPPPVAVESPQFDMFPEKPEVERLNPRAVAGEKTSVLDIVRVRMRSTEAPHLIFHDRHGWYCEAHGSECGAVLLAKKAVEPQDTGRLPGI